MEFQIYITIVLVMLVALGIVTLSFMAGSRANRRELAQQQQALRFYRQLVQKGRYSSLAARHALLDEVVEARSYMPRPDYDIIVMEATRLTVELND